MIILFCSENATILAIAPRPLQLLLLPVPTRQHRPRANAVEADERQGMYVATQKTLFIDNGIGVTMVL